MPLLRLATLGRTLRAGSRPLGKGKEQGHVNYSRDCHNRMAGRRQAAPPPAIFGGGRNWVNYSARKGVSPLRNGETGDPKGRLCESKVHKE